MQLKIAVFGSEKIVFGFIIAGFSKEENLFQVFDDDFDLKDLNQTFKNILSMEDVGIIFIADNLINHLEKNINEHKKLLPSILKIPVWHW